MVAVVYWGVDAVGVFGVCMGGVELGRVSGRLRIGVATPFVYGVCCPGGAGLCAFADDPVLPGGVAPVTGLIAYGEFAYGESGRDCGRFVGGGAKPDCEAAGEGLCCGGGENAGWESWR